MNKPLISATPDAEAQKEPNSRTAYTTWEKCHLKHPCSVNSHTCFCQPQWNWDTDLKGGALEGEENYWEWVSVIGVWIWSRYVMDIHENVIMKLSYIIHIC